MTGMDNPSWPDVNRTACESGRYPQSADGLPQGIRWAILTEGTERWLSVESDEPLYALNSSIYGGGSGLRRLLINRQVPKSYFCDDPAAEMRQFLLATGADPDRTAGMLTAANVLDAGFAFMSVGGKNGSPLRVASWVTAGLGNTARAGEEREEEELFPGTINAIILIDSVLTDAAMVNAVITATEAKAAALQDLGVRTKQSGRIASGTTTDAVIIAATQKGETYEYAGTATRLGYLIGRTIYDAAVQSANRYFDYMAKRFPSGSGF